MDVSKLLNSDFWNKKLDRIVNVRDTDRDGFITHKDYKLMEERLRQQKVSSKYMAEWIEDKDENLKRMNLKDDSVKYTYDQFKKIFLKFMETTGEKFKETFKKAFKMVDLNQNGFITFDEWIVNYTVLGIDTKYARASFNVMDKNFDGKISEDEYVAFFYEYYCTDENTLGSAILYGPL